MIGSLRGVVVERPIGGDLLLDGYLDDESMEDHQQRLDYRMHHGGLMPGNERDAVVASIAHLLRLVHVDGLELTYLAQNLKDPIWYLLRGRREDSRPPPVDSAGAVLERRVHRRDVLHEVMEWDRRYARMAIRKREMGKKIDAVTRHVAETEREDHLDLGVLAELSNKSHAALHLVPVLSPFFVQRPFAAWVMHRPCFASPSLDTAKVVFQFAVHLREMTPSVSAATHSTLRLFFFPCSWTLVASSVHGFASAFSSGRACVSGMRHK